MPKITVVMADDFVPLRDTMRRSISQDPDIEVIGEAGDGAEAIRLVEELNPEVLLLDIEMPGMDGIEVARRLHRSGVSTHVIILSIYNDRRYVQAVLEQGVDAYLTKDEPASHVINVIHRVARGETGWFSQKVSSPAGNYPGRSSRLGSTR